MSDPELKSPTGFLLVDKPAGFTSHDVVAWTRRALDERRIGHAGTLDPAATGLMVLGVGRATRLLTFLVGTDKKYEAVIRLGASTTTDDAEGDVVAQGSTEEITRLQIEAAVSKLRGEIEQRPSAVSAIKVSGKRAYQRVRDGEDVILPARPVVIHDFQVLSVDQATLAGAQVVDVSVRVHVSSGTYVRALARDIGADLGCGGHLTQLRRTSVGPFDVSEGFSGVESAVVPSEKGPQADGGGQSRVGQDNSRGLRAELISPEVVAKRAWPCVVLTEADTIAVGYGQRIPVPLHDREVAEHRSAHEAKALDEDQPPSESALLAKVAPATALFSPAGDLLAVAQEEEGRWRYKFVLATPPAKPKKESGFEGGVAPVADVGLDHNESPT